MARSYPSKRFPGGPYIEPQVMPALRGPKRTGPIGELVPGDDVEVARILARLGRKPLKDLNATLDLAIVTYESLLAEAIRPEQRFALESTLQALRKGGG